MHGMSPCTDRRVSIACAVSLDSKDSVNLLCQSCQAHSTYSVLGLRHPDLADSQLQVSFSFWSHVNQGLINPEKKPIS